MEETNTRVLTSRQMSLLKNKTMEEINKNSMKDAKLEIDGKLHKLIYDDSKPCTECSLNDFCEKNCGDWCVACDLGGQYFVELNVEK